MESFKDWFLQERTVRCCCCKANINTNRDRHTYHIDDKGRKRHGSNSCNQSGKFDKHLDGLEQPKTNENRMWVYQCPTCGGAALNGDPSMGAMYRGGAKCQECKNSFSAINQTPISKNGPLAYTKHEWADGKWIIKS